MPTIKIGGGDINDIKIGNTTINKVYRGGVLLYEKGPDGIPSNLVLTVLSDTSIQCDWTNGATNQDGTKIYYCLTENGTYTLGNTILGSGTTGNLTDLTAGTLYYVKVVHYKGAKLSNYSSIVSSTTWSIPFKSDLLAAYNFNETVDILGTTYCLDQSGNNLNAIKSTNLQTNGNCEADYGFPTLLFVAPTINERSSEQKHSGNYSRKIVCDVSRNQSIQTLGFTTMLGEVINWEFWIYGLSGTGTVKYQIFRGNGTTAALSASVALTNGAWTKVSGQYTETITGTSSHLLVYMTSGTRTFYLDDIIFSVDGVTTITLPKDSSIYDNLISPTIYYDANNDPKAVRTDIISYIDPDIGWLKLNQDNQVFYYPNNEMLLYNKAFRGTELSSIVNYIGDIFDSLTNIVTIGTGRDYTTIPLAIAGVSDVSERKKYRFDVYDDFIITDKNDYTYDGSTYSYIKIPDYVYLNGIGRRSIVCSIPATVTDNESALYEPIVIEGNGGIKNINVSMKNGRYAIHNDRLSANAIQYFKDGIYENKGNQEIIDYRISQSQPYTGIWNLPTAFGTGTRSGSTMYFYNIDQVAIQGSLGHNYYNLPVPHYKQYVNCKFTASGIYNAFLNPNSLKEQCLNIDCWQSNQENIEEYEKCTFNAAINYNATVRWEGDIALIGYKLADVLLSGKDNGTPTFINNSNQGGSLFIKSSSNGSVVITGGSAESVIIPTAEVFDFGRLGQLEVGEWDRNAGLKLGARLGDCSSVNKTLTLTVDGTQNITITFNENFTAQTNAQVLAFINTALGIYATASLYQRAKDYVPTWT